MLNPIDNYTLQVCPYNVEYKAPLPVPYHVVPLLLGLCLMRDQHSVRDRVCKRADQLVAEQKVETDRKMSGKTCAHELTPLSRPYLSIALLEQTIDELIH